MVLSLKTWKSRSLPGLPRTFASSRYIPAQIAAALAAAFLLFVARARNDDLACAYGETIRRGRAKPQVRPVRAPPAVSRAMLPVATIIGRRSPTPRDRRRESVTAEA